MAPTRKRRTKRSSRRSSRRSSLRNRKTLRGRGYLENIVSLRQKANTSARRSLELATLTQRDREGLEQADENYRASIQRTAAAILFPHTDYVLHFGIYSRTVAPIRFEETRALVHAQLPTEALRRMIAQHAQYANQAAALTRRMAEQAARLPMRNAALAQARETERRATLDLVNKINRNARLLEESIAQTDTQERIVEAEDRAFDLIRAFSILPETNDQDSLSQYSFTLQTSTDPANHYKGKRLLASVLRAPPGLAPTPVEIPPTLVRHNLPVLRKWVQVSRDLAAAMQTIPATADLHLNETKNRQAFAEGFRVENLIATYKITALVAWMEWKGRERVLPPTSGRTPTREEIQEEVKALEAELAFFGALKAWLAYLLSHRENPIGKQAMQRQLALIEEAERTGGWITLRREHARLRRMAAQTSASRVSSPAQSPAQSPTQSPSVSRSSSAASLRPSSMTRSNSRLNGIKKATAIPGVDANMKRRPFQ
jgi:hypothetical protein